MWYFSEHQRNMRNKVFFTLAVLLFICGMSFALALPSKILRSWVPETKECESFVLSEPYSQDVIDASPAAIQQSYCVWIRDATSGSTVRLHYCKTYFSAESLWIRWLKTLFDHTEIPIQ